MPVCHTFGMITSELLEFVKHHIGKETPEHKIQDMLTKQGGWRQEDIDEAFLVARFGYPSENNEQ
jgi:hypothetical protein